MTKHKQAKKRIRAKVLKKAHNIIHRNLRKKGHGSVVALTTKRAFNIVARIKRFLKK